MTGFLVYMSYILFDSNVRFQLYPFTRTRPVADVRCGILTMRERWENLLNTTTGTLTEEYLQTVFPMNNEGKNHVYINGAVFANEGLVAQINTLFENNTKGWKLVHKDLLIAFSSGETMNFSTFQQTIIDLTVYTYNDSVMQLRYMWDIFSLNDKAIRYDFELLTKGRNSALIPTGVLVSGKENLFIEEGGNIYQGCIINANTGPVYIGKDTEVLEGAMIRGPFALCEQGVLKMGAKIYGASTFGPGCKVGGEINNVVFFANSNKSHDGYLGNAVIGEWCNLGADTNCSNLKNNYEEVKVWDEYTGKLIPTGTIFCGLMMADHSKCSINTMFNTGTVVGVSCNIFGNGFPDKFVPSFSWGGSDIMVSYSFDKAIDTANRMMGRRGKQITDAEKEMFRHIFDETSKQRVKFKR